MYSLLFNPLITLHFIIYTIGVFTISIIWIQLGPQTETETQRTKPMQIKTTVKTGRVYNGNQEIVISLIDDVVKFTDQSRNINGLCQLDVTR